DRTGLSRRPCVRTDQVERVGGAESRGQVITGCRSVSRLVRLGAGSNAGVRYGDSAAARSAQRDRGVWLISRASACNSDAADVIWPLAGGDVRDKDFFGSFDEAGSPAHVEIARIASNDCG